MVNQSSLRKKFIGLSLSSAIILVTAFCAQSPSKKRDVSSNTDVSKFSPPHILTTAFGELQIYHKPAEGHSFTKLVVKFLCPNDTELSEYISENVYQYMGASQPMSWKKIAELNRSPVTDLVNPRDVDIEAESVVLVQYKAIPVVYDKRTGKDFHVEDREHRIDLKELCP